MKTSKEMLEYMDTKLASTEKVELFNSIIDQYDELLDSANQIYRALQIETEKESSPDGSTYANVIDDQYTLEDARDTRFYAPLVIKFYQSLVKDILNEST